MVYTVRDEKTGKIIVWRKENYEAAKIIQTYLQNNRTEQKLEHLIVYLALGLGEIPSDQSQAASGLIVFHDLA